MTTIMLAVIAVLLGAIAAAGLAHSLSGAASTPTMAARRRARQPDVGTLASKEYQKAPLLTRMVVMSSSGLPRSIAESFMPYAVLCDPSGTRRDSARLAQAGLSGQVTEREVHRARAWTGFLTGLVLAIVYHSNALVVPVAVPLGFVLGVRLPSFTLAAVAEARQRQCVKDLPEMIDMISLASRAGMSFDAALGAYVARFETALSWEFGAALDSWSIGAMTREEALLGVSDALDVDPVTRFVAAVVQALRLGSPLARVLESQAEDARKSQRMAVEELISKAPVKIFLPMGGLILPAMLILMLGPMMLQLLAGMGSL